MARQKESTSTELCVLPSVIVVRRAADGSLPTLSDSITGRLSAITNGFQPRRGRNFLKAIRPIIAQWVLGLTTTVILNMRRPLVYRLQFTRPMRFFLFIALFWLVSCGNSQSVSLSIKLPTGLSKGSARYERFLKRVEHLKVFLESDGGVNEELLYAPQSWESLPLPTIAFPRDPGDVLRIKAEIWDRNLEEKPRSHAVAVGEARIEASKLDAGGISTVIVPLALKVALREFDY